MKKSWWKVPLYCMVASWICFQLEIRFLGRWAIVTLPDGSIIPGGCSCLLASSLRLSALADFSCSEK